MCVFIDEEILKFKEKIEESVPSAQSASDGKGMRNFFLFYIDYLWWYVDVPGRILSQVDHVIHIATEGKTTLFKASELLEFTLNSFLYARQLALDKFDLFRRAGQALDESDQDFQRMISARMVGDPEHMDLAQQCEEECLSHLGEGYVFVCMCVHVHVCVCMCMCVCVCGCVQWNKGKVL